MKVGSMRGWRNKKITAIAICFSLVVILAACQSSSTGTPILIGTLALTSTPPLATDTPVPTATVWITPRITATPFYGFGMAEEIAALLSSLCTGQNEINSPKGWDSSNLEFVEVEVQPDPEKYWISEIANNLDNSYQAFVACNPEMCQNQIYIKDNKTSKVYEVDWELETFSYPIQKIVWTSYDTFLFFQSSGSTYNRVVAINFDKKEYIYSAIAYPRSACPIATPTLTSLPSYPLKQILVNYTVTGFHTPYDLYFTDYAWSYFVIYTDGQIIIPGNPYLQKILSKEEINKFLAQLERLGFYKIDSDHLYDFGNQEPPKITDGTSYCILATGNREQSLCSYEPYESYLVPEMKNIIQFLNNYQPEELSAYYPDRILLWIQAGRSPYVTDLPKDAIPWTEQFLPLETTSEKVIYADGEKAKEFYMLYGDRSYVFTENGKEYTVDIQVVLPHQEITNRYQ